MVVLENREVQLRHPRSNQGVAAQIPPPIARSRESQALGLDVMVGVSGVGQRMAARPSKSVRRLTGLIELHPHRIPAEDRGKWLSAACLVQTTQLPPAERPVREFRTRRRTGHLPGEAHYEILGDVEVRESARSPLVEEELVKQPVRKSVVGFCRRGRVNTLAPGIKIGRASCRE